MIAVRPITPADGPRWLALRRALWPDENDSHPREIAAFFAGPRRLPLEVLVAEDSARGVLGFVELSIRPYAEGCETARVGFLEGWYVVPEARREGVGRALVAAAEAWARGQGCREFASDTELDNAPSTTAHQALGFEAVCAIRCFRKDL
jgi:aminoglycoside 6'-N-acetyltransferase I